MGNWFDDTEDDSMLDPLALDTSATDGTSESYDAFGDADTDNANSYDDTSDNSDSTASKKNPIAKIRDFIGPKKFGALLFVIIGAILLVTIALIFGKTPEKPTKNEQTQQQQTQQQTQQPAKQQTQQTTNNNVQQGQTTSTSGWLDASGSSFDLDDGGIGLAEEFTVKDVHIYANKSGGYELRAEATGTLNNYGNSLYTVVLPVDTGKLILSSNVLKGDKPLVIKVNYKYFVNGSTIWVYDIEYVSD